MAHSRHGILFEEDPDLGGGVSEESLDDWLSFMDEDNVEREIEVREINHYLDKQKIFFE